MFSQFFTRNIDPKDSLFSSVGVVEEIENKEIKELECQENNPQQEKIPSGPKTHKSNSTVNKIGIK